MKIKKLTVNQTAVLAKVWKVFSSSTVELERMVDYHINDFKDKYGVKFNKTDMQKHLKKTFILSNYKETRIESFFKEKKMISRASFNSIETIKELHVYFLEQLLCEFKSNVKKYDSLSKKINQEDLITNKKVMGILIADYEKYLAQKTNTKTKKDALFAIDSIKNKVALQIEDIAKSFHENGIGDMSFIVLNNKYINVNGNITEKELKSLIKKILIDFDYKNNQYSLNFSVMNSKYDSLSKENIRMIADYDLSFYNKSQSIKHLTKYKDYIKEYNDFKLNIEKFKKNDPYFVNMYNEHYVYLNSIAEKAIAILNKSNVYTANIKVEVQQCDYCNDYDTPDSTYLSLSKNKDDLIPVDSYYHNTSEIGKGYELIINSKLMFNYSLLSQSGKELFKKYTKDSVLKMKKESLDLIKIINDQKKTLSTFKSFVQAPQSK